MGSGALFSVLLTFMASAEPLTSLHSTGGLNIYKQVVSYFLFTLCPRSHASTAMQAACPSLPTGLLSFWGHRHSVDLAGLTNTSSQIINFHCISSFCLHAIATGPVQDSASLPWVVMTTLMTLSGLSRVMHDCCHVVHLQGHQASQTEHRSQSAVLPSMVGQLLDSRGTGPGKPPCVSVTTSSR